MPEELFQSQLAPLVCAHIEADPTALTFTPVATGKHNRSFWVDSHQGRFVLRIAPPDDIRSLFYERHMMRQEPQLHSLIQSRTTIPLPEIVGFDFSHRLIDRDYLLMRLLPGEPLSETVDSVMRASSRTLEQVGRHARELHKLTAPACLGMNVYGYVRPHNVMEPQPSWVDAFAIMWNKLLDNVVACGCYTVNEAQHLRDCFERHRASFDRPVQSSLLHMDIWEENILVDADGNVTGMIDFDRALWGDIELEFAVLDYCDISQPAFWAGYGQTRDTSPQAELRRWFYLLYEAQKYMPLNVWRTHNYGAAYQQKERCMKLAAQLKAC